MDPIKTGHEQPVNKQAALLLAKAPWWAHYAQPAKKAVLEIVEKQKVKWDDLLSYTNPPPQQSFRKNQAIRDKRGLRIRFKDGLIGTVIGYAGKKMVFRSSGHRETQERRCLNYRGPVRNLKPIAIHSWWVEKNGEVFATNLHGHTKHIVHE
jgi:hypothetical protein